MPVVNGIEAVYWFKWWSLLFLTNILREPVIDCQCSIVLICQTSSMSEEVNGKWLKISVQENMIVKMFYLVETQANLWGLKNDVVNTDVIKKVSKLFIILIITIPKQQPYIFCQVQDFNLLPINLFLDDCIDLLFPTASTYKQRSLCKISAKQH